ncbi:N-acetylneuraminate synthase [soil metagenome]
MNIGQRTISESAPPYIIAEIGVNHDGSVARALDLVRAAAATGVNAVKFQYFRAELLMSRAARLAAYQADAGESDPVAMLARLELSLDELSQCIAAAHAANLHAIVTIFSLPLLPPALRLPWDALKTASPDIIHRPMLEALATDGRPLIISTGASTLDEVRRAGGWISPARTRTGFLQCVSAYPAAPEHAELGGVQALRAALGAPVGYSDHTREVSTGAAAVARGACMLEKHFTLDRAAAGPDHAASLEPAQMRAYVDAARSAQAHPNRADRGVSSARALGQNAVKRVLPIEADVRSVSRQSVVALRTLPRGHILAPADICFKRPGSGAPPFEAHRMFGCALTRAVDADMPIALSDAGLHPLDDAPRARSALCTQAAHR